MKRLYSVSTLFLLLAGLMLSVASCVRPDLSECPRENVRITVKTLPEASRAAFDRYDIQNVTIYVFDEQDRFVTAWQGGSYTPYHTYQAAFTLEPGNYHFVAWTNQGKTYTTNYSLDECHTDTPRKDEMRLYMACPENYCITDDIPDLHHGELSGQIVVENTTHEYTIILIPNTYQLNFTVRGIPANTSRYSFSVRDNNSHYRFDRSILAGQPEFEHLRLRNFEDGNLTASMKVLQLNETRSPAFAFDDLTEHEYNYANCLVSMIKKAYTANEQSVDFSTTFDFDIVITFQANSDVNIAVNGWSYVENNTEL
ncbi:FimB/Mfa2 family fimbrial subunit [Alistipes sp. OttesenSCG-928-L06]|nr:FimB/Mfa2 family fimbrial subunit [Alistipes sp. OttesenSCG-928-L06]